MISEQLHKDAIRFKEWHEGRAAQAKNCATFNVTPALQEIAAGHEKVAATIAALLDALPQPAPSPQPAAPVVSDEQIDALAAGNNYPGTVPGYRRFARAILALRSADHPDTLRCIKARNDLNAALHGEGASIDDLEHAVANACAKLRRPAVEPMMNEQKGVRDAP